MKRREFLHMVELSPPSARFITVSDRINHSRRTRVVKKGSDMRQVLVIVMVATFLLAGAGVARADHTHVLILPNGKCAILAANGNEKYQILPDVLFRNNPNVDADDDAGGLDNLPMNRRHPLHVLVHLGVPGADGDIAVMGSAADPCAVTG